MIPSAILARYARSLADVVFEENVEQKVTGDLQIYREIFRACPEVLEAFDTPSVQRETREKILSELMARYPVHPVASNFLRILLQHSRIRYFEQILDIYVKLIGERKGVVSAKVTSADPLSEDEIRDLTARLAAITGKRVDIAVETDQSLIGGLVVQMGSTVFDGSIRTQLAEMKRRLAETR